MEVRIAMRIYGPYNAPPISKWVIFKKCNFLTVEADVPPKLPETTNLVLIKSKKDHSEIKPTKTRTKLENKIPPL